MDLQTAWFLLVGVLLTGYAILDGFDLGVGMWHLVLARNDTERRLLLNSVGPVWDGNEVWLLTGGGAIFAAFPRVYATVFSGLYVAFMLLLSALVFRGVSLEFRRQIPSPRWRATWDVVFSVSSLLASLLFGVAIGNVLRGLPLTPDGEFAGSFLGLLSPFALLTGLLSVAMFAMHGAAWLVLKTEGELQARARRAGLGAWGVFTVLWIGTTALSLAAAPHLWSAYGRAAAWLAPVVFVGLLVAVPLGFRGGRRWPPFAATSAAVASLMAVMGQGLYPVLVPALGGGEGLTIYSACSTPRTLTVMLIIALAGMPVVLFYTAFIYRSFRGPVVLDEQSY